MPTRSSLGQAGQLRQTGQGVKGGAGRGRGGGGGGGGWLGEGVAGKGIDEDQQADGE